METIHSTDNDGNLRWTPVPEGYSRERVVAILQQMGHTVHEERARKAQ